MLVALTARLCSVVKVNIIKMLGRGTRRQLRDGSRVQGTIYMFRTTQGQIEFENGPGHLRIGDTHRSSICSRNRINLLV